MDIVIIGTGMYTTGRGTDGYGTIIPAIIEWKRQYGFSGGIKLVGTNGERSQQAMHKIKSLESSTGVNLNIDVFPKNNTIDQDCYKKILNDLENPTCAIVAVPDHLHQKIASDCIKAGLHTLVVKPLTPTIAGARELISLQKKYNTYGATEFHKRYDRHNLKLKEAMQNNEIGDPLYFIVEYSQRKIIPKNFFSLWTDYTNIFQYLGVHYVDIIYFITGAKPTKLQVKGQYGWLKKNGINAYDAIHVTIEWEINPEKKFVSFIHTNWIDPNHTSAMSDQRIKLIGTEGRLESNQKNRGLEKVTDANKIEIINPDFCNTYPAPNGDIIYRGYGIDSIQTFLTDVKNIDAGHIGPEDLEGERPTFTDSLVSTSVIEAVNIGLDKQGIWIDIPL